MKKKEDAIRNKLKDSPELLEYFEEVLKRPRERDEIYMYCFQRETIDGKTHYTPLLTILDGENDLMACWDIHLLQEDYEKEVRRYKMNGYPLCIIEVSFTTYLRLRDGIRESLNRKKPKNLDEMIKTIKTHMLFRDLMPQIYDCNDDFTRKLYDEKNYCKCLDENYEIVECTNYKPIKTLTTIQ